MTKGQIPALSLALFQGGIQDRKCRFQPERLAQREKYQRNTYRQHGIPYTAITLVPFPLPPSTLPIWSSHLHISSYSPRLFPQSTIRDYHFYMHSCKTAPQASLHTPPSLSRWPAHYYRTGSNPAHPPHHQYSASLPRQISTRRNRPCY